MIGRSSRAASADRWPGVKLRYRRVGVNAMGYAHAPLPTLSLSAYQFLCHISASSTAWLTALPFPQHHIS